MLTCGITLNTKTLLGVSPVISVPNCLSLLYGWKLGWLVTVLYLGCVLIQIPLKGRRFRALDLMQFPVSVRAAGWWGLYDTWLNSPPGPAPAAGAAGGGHPADRGGGCA